MCLHTSSSETGMLSNVCWSVVPSGTIIPQIRYFFNPLKKIDEKNIISPSSYNTPMEKPSTLKQEALGIIDELSLLDFLVSLGESWLVGSVALDLIVKPDIDIHLLIDHDDLLKTSDQIYHYLLTLALVPQRYPNNGVKHNSINIRCISVIRNDHDTAQ